jgi:preprotein translocase subunit SecA
VASAQSLAARRRSGEDSDQVLAEILVTCARAVRLVTGQVPAEEVVAAAANAAVGIVPLVPDGDGRRVALAMTAYWHATAGEGVHVMAASQQEAEPVKQFLARVFDQLGSSVGLLGRSVGSAYSASVATERRSAYSADVTVGSCAEFPVDLLRDDLVLSASDMVQRRLSRLVVADVDETVLSRAREQTVITAPPDGKALPAAAELATGMRSGVDYRPDLKQRAVCIDASAMAQIKAGVGWTDLPTAWAVSKAMAVERELLRREGLARPDERQVIADVALHAYVREYPIVTGFTGTPDTDAARLARLYGLDAISRRSALTRRVLTTHGRLRYDEEEVAFEELFDAQRRTTYDLRRRVRDQPDPEEIARGFVADLAEHWSTQGAAAVREQMTYVLRRDAPFHIGDDSRRIRATAIRVLTAALDQVDRRSAPSDRRQFIRRTMLAIIDRVWREHIARTRFLQRQAAGLYLEPGHLMQRKRDLDHLFEDGLRVIERDSLRYVLAAADV